MRIFHNTWKCFQWSDAFLLFFENKRIFLTLWPKNLCLPLNPHLKFYFNPWINLSVVADNCVVEMQMRIVVYTSTHCFFEVICSQDTKLVKMEIEKQLKYTWRKTLTYLNRMDGYNCIRGPVDYAFTDNVGKVLGIVEAKSISNMLEAKT